MVKVYYSMLKACICGAIIAFAFIFLQDFLSKNYSEKAKAISNTKIANEAQLVKTNIPHTAILEEADQDPSFVSRFSRVFIYSADNGKEVIESAKTSLARTTMARKISATSYVVIDLDRNVILMEKNPEKALPIASITKLVTAVMTKKLLNEDDTITITSRALLTYGNEAWLKEGEKLKVGELLHPLLMVSSNDASEALAGSYKKGRKEFIKEMNSWVNSIGAYRTYFDDPSGLSHKNVSTSKDISIIIKWIVENEPDIFKITTQKSKSIRFHTWTNPTHFLNLSSYAGGKNGYTFEANRTSVALFKLGKANRLYGIILLGSSNRDSDILDLLEEALR